MPSPILARADALMQRRRQNSAEADDIPVLTDSVEPIDSDDDVPVLLDVESFVEPEPPVAEIEEAEPVVPLAEAHEPAFDAALRDILAHELARRVEQRIAAELPRIIEATVRDFLAEQENITALQSRD
ncbi:hypothetical protein [Dechloromonas sp. A34]|uniref:hypothetical protein n=1 Tax=Dechloromonas sp. A34 TaxID=447588 RepID=UPI002248B9AB|nr:hypothetical protein [Dechloromonas sp. A34]